MPQNQAYYLPMDGSSDNRARAERELIVNCCGLAVLSQPFRTHHHTGREDYYLQYMVHGEMDIWMDGEQALMTAGQAMIYYPHTPYHYAMRGEQQVQYYWVHFTGSLAESLVKSCGLPNRAMLEIGADDQLIRHFQSLFQEFITRDDCFAYQCASRLTAILVAAARKSAHAGPDQRLRQPLAYIHSHYARPISIEDLAGLGHLSVSRFRDMFRAGTGLSPLAYLIGLRISHAKQLLVQTDMRISEIADAVGYQDQLYFSRIFKGKTGSTPTKYRRNHRG